MANKVFFDRAHNLLFLTRANMAGKSTLMKSNDFPQDVSRPLPDSRPVVSCVVGNRDYTFNLVAGLSLIALAICKQTVKNTRMNEIIRAVAKGIMETSIR